MTTALAMKNKSGPPAETARSPSELAPLIKEQIQLGDMAAEEAGMPYYQKAGGLLLEAQTAKKIAGEYSEEWFEEYCRTVAHREMATCREWIRGYKKEVAKIEHSNKSGKRYTAAKHLRGSIRPSDKGQYRPFREWTAPVDAVVDVARRQQLKAADDRAAEQKRKQELARKLIDSGVTHFKLLNRGNAKEKLAAIRGVCRDFGMERAFNMRVSRQSETLDIDEGQLAAILESVRKQAANQLPLDLGSGGAEQA